MIAGLEICFPAVRSKFVSSGLSSAFLFFTKTSPGYFCITGEVIENVGGK